eukprot:CAMPEP_0178996914 /NCGR_PEP_ID=MMETSP0795-20121207/8640_1 /TAXON_ID=88552 /ORGANISM="Amoebophrya sp., Strain Ameob2" /LENGTH=350 /DNA_ID=CAMNT_0020689371 /DNA_START=339 /DNA_END=1391 /DNA_ORIENTATION=+
MGCGGSKQQGAKSGPSALNEKEQGRDSNTIASLSQPQEEEDRAAPNDKDNPTPGKRSSLKREKQADEAAPSGTPGDTQEDGEQKRVSFAETATVFNPIIQPHEYSESSEGGSSHELHLHNASAPDEQSAAASFSSASEDNAVFDAQEHEQNGSAAALTPAGAARAHPLPQLEALRGSSILEELQAHSSYFDRIEYDAAAGGAAVKSATQPPGETVTCVQDVYLIPSPTGGDVGLGGAFSYGAGGTEGAVVEEQGHDGFDKHDAATVGGPDDEESQGHDEGPRNSLPENAVETKMATRASMSTSGAGAFAGKDEDEESNPAEVTSRTESKEGDPARTISTTSTLSTEGSSS